MGGVFNAHVLNNVLLVPVIIGYAAWQKKGVPRSMDDLMVIPQVFGTENPEWMNMRIADGDEVMNVSRTLQYFCTEHGVDSRRSYLVP